MTARRRGAKSRALAERGAIDRSCRRLPGRTAALCEGVEPLLVLDRVHRLPEAVVLVRDELALFDQPANGSSTSSSPGLM